MASLKIQVLGRGLIPRGYGLAPHIDPFAADKTLIATILATPGLKVNYINPETGKAAPLTSKNLNVVWKKHADTPVKTESVQAPAPTHPYVPIDSSRIPEKKEDADPPKPAAPAAPAATKEPTPPATPAEKKPEPPKQEEKKSEDTESSKKNDDLVIPRMGSKNNDKK